MIKINIITSYSSPILIHQLDRQRFQSSIYFAENSLEPFEWDYVVVFQNLDHRFDGIKYRKGGLIYIAGEPESMDPYCRRFFNQFDYVIAPHPHLKGKNIFHENPALNWHYGRSFKNVTFKYNYEDLANKTVEKSKSISMMCSSKTMLPGHILRYSFYQLLRKNFQGQIDFYGAGIQLVDDKADILDKYRFHICIENSADDHYWTEKIADPILGFSVPIYYGAPNITDYFPQGSIILIDINNPEEALHTIGKILQNPEEEYNKHYSSLLKARDLLLNKYNIFPMLESFILRQNPALGEMEQLQLIPYTEMFEWKVRMSFARLRRFVFKLFHSKCR